MLVKGVSLHSDLIIIVVRVGITVVILFGMTIVSLVAALSPCSLPRSFAGLCVRRSTALTTPTLAAGRCWGSNVDLRLSTALPTTLSTL